ncbi:MAG TPA: septal ring lytic transglycosylase RlpA family protein [Candidatus Binatia bacterium]
MTRLQCAWYQWSSSDISGPSSAVGNVKPISDLSLGLLLVTVISITACSVPPSRIPPPITPPRASQTGIASWYGPGFHGKATASGVIYNQHDLTAAHQTLPLGTRVLVTNLENGRSVEVLINDRGPFAKGRIIDLSYAAAESLGMVGPGTIPVRIEVVGSGADKVSLIKDSLDYTLQLGSFSVLENARQLRDLVARQFSEVAIVPLNTSSTTYYRVQLGKFSTRSSAEEQARRVTQAGYPVVILEKW